MALLHQYYFSKEVKHLVTGSSVQDRRFFLSITVDTFLFLYPGYGMQGPQKSENTFVFSSSYVFYHHPCVSWSHR